MAEILSKQYILERVAENIRLERKRKRLSQEALAELVNVSTNHITNIENNKTNPTITIIVNLCRVLNLDLNKILKTNN